MSRDLDRGMNFWLSRVESKGLHIASAINSLDAVYELYWDREHENDGGQHQDLMAIIYTVARSLSHTQSELDACVVAMQDRFPEPEDEEEAV